MVTVVIILTPSVVVLEAEESSANKNKTIVAES